ncbi:hypothetical protein IWQ62_000254 [Dispira parvispora]|uniref:2Fe-2S ferredoxin-type domain-containing protein n=1 Tax=Dispira parvispora TaxID=1520584 RepID=A0A9W8B143_9FUNG|nr:hypothetical protein IWQ62_000254 [Dispira parvispora]
MQLLAFRSIIAQTGRGLPLSAAACWPWGLSTKFVRQLTTRQPIVPPTVSFPVTAKPLADGNDIQFHHSVKPHHRQLVLCTGKEPWPRFSELINTYAGKLSQMLAKVETGVIFQVTDLASEPPTEKTLDGPIPTSEEYDLLLFPEHVRIRRLTTDDFLPLVKYLNQTKADPTLLTLMLGQPRVVAADETPDRSDSNTTTPKPHRVDIEPLNRQYVFTCTHGTRDCRCGDIGEPLHTALEREIRLRDQSSHWVAARISHIGGHAYAGNVIHHPAGDWYGLLKPSDAPRLLDSLQQEQIWWGHWRGRLGLTSQDQETLYITETTSKRGLNSPDMSSPKSTNQVPVRLDYVLPNNTVRQVTIQLDPQQKAFPSLMEVSKDHGIDLEAVCGGQCECATCHLQVENLTEYAQHLPLTSEAEEDMLEYTTDRQDNSRLSCQIPVTPALSGIRLRVPGQ